MAALGTLRWLADTNGKMGFVDKLRFVAHGVQARIAARHRLQDGPKRRNREVDDVLPPDSAIAREAMALCEAASTPALFNHSMRAYFWARLLDDGAGSFDDEAVFVALMLHDLGLTDRYRLHGSREQCFTIVGARIAEELGVRHAWPEPRARLAAEAIALHLNVIVDAGHGREAQMVRAGTGGDVAGLGLDRLDEDQIRTVCAKHPRLDFTDEVRAAFAIETRERPECRVAFLTAKLGFDRLIMAARFPA